MTKDKDMMIYQTEDGAIQLSADNASDTVWASQKQIAQIFGVKIPTISEHIKSI